MVEQVCGSPKEKFIKVAEMLLENSGRDRTSAFAYAVAWTQHTYGVQMISCCALRSEEHTSELQSQSNLVCRLLLEKIKSPILSNPHFSQISSEFHKPRIF